MIENLNKYYLSREEVINFFKDYVEIILDAGWKAKQAETKVENKCFKGYQ